VSEPRTKVLAITLLQGKLYQTYQSAHGLHEQSISTPQTPWALHKDSMSSPWTVHGVHEHWALHEQSMNSPWAVHEQSTSTPWGPWTVHEHSMSSPWEPVGDCKIQLLGIACLEDRFPVVYFSTAETTWNCLLRISHNRKNWFFPACTKMILSLAFLGLTSEVLLSDCYCAWIGLAWLGLAYRT
jgi:hypothetical protein